MVPAALEVRGVHGDSDGAVVAEALGGIEADFQPGKALAGLHGFPVADIDVEIEGAHAGEIKTLGDVELGDGIDVRLASLNPQETFAVGYLYAVLGCLVAVYNGLIRVDSGAHVVQTEGQGSRIVIPAMIHAQGIRLRVGGVEPHVVNLGQIQIQLGAVRNVDGDGVPALFQLFGKHKGFGDLPLIQGAIIVVDGEIHGWLEFCGIQGGIADVQIELDDVAGRDVHRLVKVNAQIVLPAGDRVFIALEQRADGRKALGVFGGIHPIGHTAAGCNIGDVFAIGNHFFVGIDLHFLEVPNRNIGGAHLAIPCRLQDTCAGILNKHLDLGNRLHVGVADGVGEGLQRQNDAVFTSGQDAAGQRILEEPVSLVAQAQIHAGKFIGIHNRRQIA